MAFGRFERPYIATLLVVFGFASTAMGQLGTGRTTTANNGQLLTLQRALELALERNGTIKSAQFDVGISGQRLIQARSELFPEVIARYRYDSNRAERDVDVFAQQEGGSSTIGASWRLLDLGERQWSVLGSSRALDATRWNARQTLRSTLFSVHEIYFDALKAAYLVDVQQQQVRRAETIREQTLVRIRLEDLPQKDEKQAQADLLNARVAVLQATNQLTDARARLKAIVGWNPGDREPELQAPEIGDPSPVDDLNLLYEEGISNRPDLRSRRRTLEAQRFAVLRAETAAGLGFAVDLTFDQAITPTRLQDRRLALTLSLPVFDGGSRKAVASEARLQYSAINAEYDQAVLDARAEIEAAYKQLLQNRERFDAARAALEAAEENYRFAEAANLNNIGNLIEVLTAQVSLTTAQSNYIEALYDAIISEVRLRLVVGRPLPGEQSPEPQT
jgi:outer membrane protein